MSLIWKIKISLLSRQNETYPAGQVLRSIFRAAMVNISFLLRAVSAKSKQHSRISFTSAVLMLGAVNVITFCVALQYPSPAQTLTEQIKFQCAVYNSKRYHEEGAFRVYRLFDERIDKARLSGNSKQINALEKDVKYHLDKWEQATRERQESMVPIMVHIGYKEEYIRELLSRVYKAPLYARAYNSSDPNAWKEFKASKLTQDADYHFQAGLSSNQIAPFCEAYGVPDINKQLIH